MSKESNIQVSTAAVNKKRPWDLGKARKESRRDNTKRTHKLSGLHIMKSQLFRRSMGPF